MQKQLKHTSPFNGNFLGWCGSAGSRLHGLKWIFYRPHTLPNVQPTASVWNKQELQNRKSTWAETNTTIIRTLLSQMNTIKASGYATMVHGRGCNPHRSTTTFANLEITSLWRHWWRHNSETIRDREKQRPPRHMKSSELSNGENRIALRQLLQNRKLCHLWRHNLG